MKKIRLKENKKIDFWKDLKLVKQKADEMKIEI